MIELYIILTLLGFGYILKEKRDLFTSPTNIKKNLDPNEVPSYNNIYDSNAMEAAKLTEFEAATKSYQQSIGLEKDRVINREYIRSQLADMEIPADKFHKQTVQPFYRGTANTANQSTSHIMENFGALNTQDVLHLPKKEVEAFFQPENNVNNGNNVEKDFNEAASRYKTNVSNKQNNVLPFEQIRVGPGLNIKTVCPNTGGFHQFETADIVRKSVKTIDDMRVGNRVQETHVGQMIESVQKEKRRAEIKEISNRKPNTFFEMTEDMYFKTTGANLQPRQQSEFPKKETNRISSVEYVGNIYKNNRQNVNTENMMFKNSKKESKDCSELTTSLPYNPNKIHIVENYLAKRTRRLSHSSRT